MRLRPFECQACGIVSDEHVSGLRQRCFDTEKCDQRLVEAHTPTDPGAAAVLHVDTDEEPVDSSEALT